MDDVPRDHEPCDGPTGCGGTGWVKAPVQLVVDGKTYRMPDIRCARCNGTGKVPPPFVLRVESREQGEMPPQTVAAFCQNLIRAHGPDRPFTLEAYSFDRWTATPTLAIGHDGALRLSVSVQVREESRADVWPVTPEAKA